MDAKNAIATAYRNISYSTRFLTLNKTLSEVVQHVHKFMSEKSEWTYRPLAPGSFGHDNMAVCIFELLENITDGVFSEQDTKHVLASSVHESWAKNYTYWLQTPPAHPYRRPYQPLGDERRNKLAQTPYALLPTDEQEKDCWIVEGLFSLINQIKV